MALHIVYLPYIAILLPSILPLLYLLQALKTQFVLGIFSAMGAPAYGL